MNDPHRKGREPLTEQDPAYSPLWSVLLGALFEPRGRSNRHAPGAPTPCRSSGHVHAETDQLKKSWSRSPVAPPKRVSSALSWLGSCSHSLPDFASEPGVGLRSHESRCRWMSTSHECPSTPCPNSSSPPMAIGHLYRHRQQPIRHPARWDTLSLRQSTLPRARPMGWAFRLHVFRRRQLGQVHPGLGRRALRRGLLGCDRRTAAARGRSLRILGHRSFVRWLCVLVSDQSYHRTRETIISPRVQRRSRPIPFEVVDGWPMNAEPRIT